MKGKAGRCGLGAFDDTCGFHPSSEALASADLQPQHGLGRAGGMK